MYIHANAYMHSPLALATLPQALVQDPMHLYLEVKIFSRPQACTHEADASDRISGGETRR
jgi:hypothetical protein